MAERAGLPGERALVHRVIARLNVGGPAMHVVHLTAGLPTRGFASRLLVGRVTDDEGDMEYYARERGAELVRVPGLDRRLRPLALLRSFLFLYRTFRRYRPEVVHTHTAMAGAVGRAAAILAGVPVRVHTYHGHVLGGEYFPRWATALFLRIERLLGRRTHALIALTDAQADQMANELGIAPRSRFVVIPLGLDLERFRLPAPVRDLFREKVRGELGLSPGARVIGIVGRLVPVKNHELLFQAFRVLLDTATPSVGPGPDVHLAVVGGGERENELRELAGALGIAERVHWMGWRRDMPEIYPAFDVLGLTSRDEGTPVAVIEALAAGVPVVARAVGGVPGVLEGGKWGTLVQEERPEAFAVALSRALQVPRDPEAREAASARARERFSEEKLVREVGALYRSLLSKRSPSY